MESDPQGQDPWETVEGSDADPPENTPVNASALRKWKIRAGKAMFVIKASVRTVRAHSGRQDSERGLGLVCYAIFPSKRCSSTTPGKLDWHTNAGKHANLAVFHESQKDM